MTHVVRPEVRHLEILRRRLQKALEAEDWNTVGAVSADIRNALRDLAARPVVCADIDQARARLGALHASAVEACEDECQRLREILQRHVENAEGRAAYTRVEGIGGVEA